MLTNKRIIYLCSLVGLKPVLSERGNVIYIKRERNERFFKEPYEHFKEQMGLDDLPFHWLVGPKNYIAGGAVLAWILGEPKHTDIDFFFKDIDTIPGFVYFLNGTGMVSSNSDTDYAYTLFDEESSVIFQAIKDDGFDDLESARSGSPIRVIDSFDINICKFAVDEAHVYGTYESVADLIQRRIDNDVSADRLVKYIHKGFFPK